MTEKMGEKEGLGVFKSPTAVIMTTRDAWPALAVVLLDHRYMFFSYLFSFLATVFFRPPLVIFFSIFFFAIFLWRFFRVIVANSDRHCRSSTVAGVLSTIIK